MEAVTNVIHTQLLSESNTIDYHTLNHVIDLPTTRASSKLPSTLEDAKCAIVVVPCLRVRCYEGIQVDNYLHDQMEFHFCSGAIGYQGKM